MTPSEYLAGFPDHVHLGEGQVEPGSRIRIIDLVVRFERDLGG